MISLPGTLCLLPLCPCGSAMGKLPDPAYPPPTTACQGRPHTLHVLTAGLAPQDLAAGVAENLRLQLRYIAASLHAALAQAGDPAPAAARCAQVR